LVTVPDQPGGPTVSMQVRSATPGFFIDSGNDLFDVFPTTAAPFDEAPPQLLAFGVPEPTSQAFSILGIALLTVLRKSR
jgi:hypothetical protein